MTVASKAREISTLPFIIGKGRCAQFKALEAVISNTPSGFQFSPIEDCARACAFFPQCMAFQVAGSVTGAAGACDLRDPAASPLFGDFAGLPPTTVFVGTHELLLPALLL